MIFKTLFSTDLEGRKGKKRREDRGNQRTRARTTEFQKEENERIGWTWLTAHQEELQEHGGKGGEFFS